MDIAKQEYLNMEYLKELKARVKANKIIFDVDYNWNIDSTSGEIDNESIKRVINTWDSYDCERIFYKNAKEIYKKIRN